MKSSNYWVLKFDPATSPRSRADLWSIFAPPFIYYGLGVKSGEFFWQPETDADRRLILDQLELVLASPGFQNSQRYPALLRFLVEQRLCGNTDRLKERIIGIEVFGRAADYDTNQFPVVRISAAEVRKRLKEYYSHPDHQQEPVIRLTAGSYVPCFELPESVSSPSLEPVLPAAGEAIEEAKRSDKRLSLRGLARPRIWGVALLASGALAFALWHFILQQESADRFWFPLIRSSSPVTLCVGSPRDIEESFVQHDRMNADPPERNFSRISRLSPEVAYTAVLSGAILGRLHKTFRFVEASQTSLSLLQEGPVVLIGSGDNIWTTRSMMNLRYSIRHDGVSGVLFVYDQKKKVNTGWSASYASLGKQTRDYIAIARYQDTTLGQPVVILAGMLPAGTLAAGKAISNPEFLHSLFQRAPFPANTTNMEAVVQVDLVDLKPARMSILAVEYW